MGTATVETLTPDSARGRLHDIEHEIGPLDQARLRSAAGLLSIHEEALLRRAAELAWLLSEE